MGKPSKAVLEFMQKYNIDSDEIWEVHGTTWVVKHKALERVAVEVGIAWEKPELKVCDMANGFALVLIGGKLGDHVEHSFGEASPKNNKNSYPVAMAEKRAKDRVILKLLVTHGALYSESEADEFAQPAKRENPHVTRAEDIFPVVQYDEHGQPIDNIPLAEGIKALPKKDSREIYKRLQDELNAHTNIRAFRMWGTTIASRVATLPSDWQEIFRGQYAERLDELKQKEVA